MNTSNIANLSSLLINQLIVKDHPVVVSCDAHSESTYIFAVDTRTGEILFDRNIFGASREITKAVKKIGVLRDIVVLYEAGSLGFSLYRRLRELGYYCRIIAPSSIPKRQGPKTDRDDAIGNFRYYCSGLLKFVWVPDLKIENGRECLRCRHDLMAERTGEKVKIQAMLKRQGIIYTLTKSPWTKRFYLWLKELSVAVEVRTVLDIRLSRIAMLDEHIQRVEKQVMALIANDVRMSRLYQIYNTLPGIGPLGAMTWVLEGGDLNRFASPLNLMSYLGVVPRKKSSGKRNPSLGITKAGNVYLRYVTVCAAGTYFDRRKMQKEYALKKLPKPLAELVGRCRNRLCKRCVDLRRNKKNGNKIKVAIARELCGYIWELAVKVLPQIEEKQLPIAA